MASIKPYLINILLAVVSVGIMLVFIDVVCWFSPLQYRILPPHEPQGYLQFDSKLGYDIAPNQPVQTLTFS